MAQGTTVTLLPYKAHPGTEGTIYAYTGDQQQAAAYYLANRDLQTIVWTMSSDFIGDIEIQASLVDSPTDSDWFFVYSIDTLTELVGYNNLSGNFVWLRASVSNWTKGIINLVTASY